MASRKKEKYRVGIDIGGTFTDVVLMGEEEGLIASYKVDTTPVNLEGCFVNGLQRATRGISPEEVGRILHATTVATNTVLESKGARTALVTTQGFRDILEIARQRRPSLYNLQEVKAKPLIPRRLSFEVNERLAWNGDVVTKLTKAELDRLADALDASGAESVVIALLFSYVNPVHELRVKKHLLRALPGRHIVASSDITPEFREFERTSTAALVGYLKPIFARYTERLHDEVSQARAPPRKTPHHEFGRRADVAGICARTPPHAHRIRPRGGCHRRHRSRARARRTRHHLLRHGRHNRQDEPD